MMIVCIVPFVKDEDEGAATIRLSAHVSMLKLVAMLTS